MKARVVHDPGSLRSTYEVTRGVTAHVRSHTILFEVQLKVGLTPRRCLKTRRVVLLDKLLVTLPLAVIDDLLHVSLSNFLLLLHSRFFFHVGRGWASWRVDKGACIL